MFVERFVSSMLSAVMPSGFTNMSDVASMSSIQALYLLVLVVVYLVLVLLLGKWLFNTVLVKLFPAVHPATSVWQILGLVVLLHLLLP